MAIALVAQVKGSGNDTFTTGSVDTTGADLLVATFADVFAGGSPPALSDSKGNTWVQAIRSNPINRSTSIYYAWNPTVGTGHTFTLTGTDFFASIQVSAFSGAETASDPFDQSNSNFAVGSTTTTTGSVTPTTDGQVLVTHLNFDFASSMPTLNGGFVSPSYGDAGSAGVYLGSGVSYLIQTTAAAANPTWTSPTSGNLYATIATFEAASGAAFTESPVDALGLTDSASVQNVSPPPAVVIDLQRVI